MKIWSKIAVRSFIFDLVVFVYLTFTDKYIFWMKTAVREGKTTRRPIKAIKKTLPYKECVMICQLLSESHYL